MMNEAHPLAVLSIFVLISYHSFTLPSLDLKVPIVCCIGYHAQGHDLNVFQTFLDTIFTPKKWFLSKKGPKEGERVARGHFHERVGETPVHWLPPGVGITPKPFFVSENGPFENFLKILGGRYLLEKCEIVTLFLESIG